MHARGPSRRAVCPHMSLEEAGAAWAVWGGGWTVGQLCEPHLCPPPPARMCVCLWDGGEGIVLEVLGVLEVHTGRPPSWKRVDHVSHRRVLEEKVRSPSPLCPGVTALTVYLGPFSSAFMFSGSVCPGSAWALSARDCVGRHCGSLRDARALSSPGPGGLGTAVP